MDPSRTDAKKDKFMGSVKDNVGSVFGNESLQAEGKSQNSAGAVQETAANVQGYVQGAADNIAGAVKGAYHSLTGNTSSEMGDKAQKAKGEAQKEWNS